jgi:hypothetical protein
VDDFGVIDPAQVSRRDPEVGMPELALDDRSEIPSRDISTARRSAQHAEQATGRPFCLGSVGRE